MIGPEVRRFADADALAIGAADEIARQVERLVTERGSCRLALAGGSTPRPVYERLARRGLAGRIDWRRTSVFFTDERCVPSDDDRSNYRMVMDTLLRHVPVPEANVHRIEGELDPVEAARRYAETLGEQPLDLVLLGMGDDGHVASLFPGTPELREDGARAVATRSPVPPRQRVSLSLRTLNESRQVLFLVSGSAKADRLAEAIRQSGGASPTLPAAMVRARSLVWLVDAGAAGCL